MMLKIDWADCNIVVYLFILLLRLVNLIVLDRHLRLFKLVAIEILPLPIMFAQIFRNKLYLNRRLHLLDRIAKRLV